MNDAGSPPWGSSVPLRSRLEFIPIGTRRAVRIAGYESHGMGPPDGR